MKTAKLVLPLVLVAALITIAIWRMPTESANPQQNPPEPAFGTFVEEIMATPITVTVPASAGRAAADIVFAVFHEVDDRMSEWKPTSPLSEVNKNAGVKPVEVPADLRDVVRRGLDISQLTLGAFDVTWAALWGLWDFKAADPRVPSDEAIAARVDLVDYHAVQIDDEAGTIYLPRKGMLIGLGGIAKGHALDQAAAALRKAGVSNFLISAGGQVYAGGTHGDRPWRVGIRDPRGPADDYFAFVDVRDASLSTSGDYERFFMLNGVRYHHILDPRTGRPTRGTRSVTVIAPDATLADALSTAFMVLGPEASLKLAQNLPDLGVVIVDTAGVLHIRYAGDLQVTHPPTE